MKENVAFCCPSFGGLLPKNMLLVLLLVLLLALPVPKAGREVPKPPVVVAGVAPKGDLPSPNVAAPLLVVPAPNAKPAEFCPKVFVVEEGKAPTAVTFVPNAGTDVLSVPEPNKLPPVVPPKAGVLAVFCTFAAVAALGAPNAGVALLAALKAGVMVLPADALAMPNVGAVVVCVEPNNGADVLPNMLAPLPKDVVGFACPKIADVLLPNTDDAVVEFVLMFALEKRPELAGLSDEDALVIPTKIDAAVVFGLLNIFVAPGVDVAAPKTG